MEIVFTNPCLLGDVICGVAPIQVYKQLYPESHITYIYEENGYNNPKEPISILERDKSIDSIICVPRNTIPRALHSNNDTIKPWAENYLGKKIDIFRDLHKHWRGSNGRNWFDCAGLDFDKYYTRLNFFPTDDDDAYGLQFKDMVGISDRLPFYREIIEFLNSKEIPCCVIGESLGVSVMKVYCAIKNLKVFVTILSLHNALCWATNTPNLVCWSVPPEFMDNHGNPDITLDYQNENTTIVRTWNKDIVLGYLENYI